MDTIFYIGSLACGLFAIAAAGGLLLALIEGAWWIYTRATGREY